VAGACEYGNELWGCGYWMELAQDRDSWRAIGSTVMKCRVWVTGVQTCALPIWKPDVDGRVILGWIFKKWDVGLRTGSIWLRIGAGNGYL
jgi:hypothetical protein